jgi:cyclopropane fatty-acyl-phospholipid synthase-like methyltransferase
MNLSSREEQVRRYYDRNTIRFLRFARTFAPSAIHQPLYMSAGMSLTDALHTPHRMLLEQIPEGGDAFSILDLGCGVGESMRYLAGQTPDHIAFYGITLSGEQAEMARRINNEAGAKHIDIFQGSFQAIPTDIPCVDLAFAIESFIHSTDAGEFFAEVAARLQPGGQLILFDDFLSDKLKSSDRVLQDFRTGWLAQNLLSQDQITKAASDCGLGIVESRNLTQMLRLNRPRDRFIRLIAPIARPFMDWSEYCRFLVGGNARQLAYQKGLLGYRMIRFERM